MTSHRLSANIRHRHANETGLTLVEVVLALAISSLVILMATTALSAASGYMKRQQQHDEAKQTMEDAFRLVRYELKFIRKLNVASSKKIEFDTALLHRENNYQIPGRSSFECVKSQDGRTQLIHHSYPLVSYSGEGKKFLLVNASTQIHTQVLISELNTCAFDYGLSEVLGNQSTKPAEWISDWTQQLKEVRLVRLRISTRYNTWPSSIFVLDSHAQ